MDLCFSDVSEFAAAIDLSEVNVLTCDKVFPLSAPNIIFSELATHQWGEAYTVEFDPNKMKMIHPRLGVGTAFKIIGVMADCKLTIDLVCERIVRKVRPKTRSLIRKSNLTSGRCSGKLEQSTMPQ